MSQEETKKRQQDFAERSSYNLKRYLEEPKQDRERRIQEVCSRCRFAYGDRSHPKTFSMRWCNWDLYHENRIRPCAGRDCVAMGIFEPAENTRETVIKMISRETYAKMSEKRGKQKP